MAHELYELNHRHMAIAEYLIANPAARLEEVSAAVGLSPAWISTLTNSELFRNYLKERHDEIKTPLTLSIHEKLLGVASSAVEKLGRMVDNSTDPNFILAAADKTLKNLGYGAQKGPAIQVNNITQTSNNLVSSEVLREARAKVYQLAEVRNRGALPSPSPGGACAARAFDHVPASEGVQAREGRDLGNFEAPAAAVYSAEEGDGPEGPGHSVRGEGVRFPRELFALSAASESLD